MGSTNLGELILVELGSTNLGGSILIPRQGPARRELSQPVALGVS